MLQNLTNGLRNYWNHLVCRNLPLATPSDDFEPQNLHHVSCRNRKIQITKKPPMAVLWFLLDLCVC